MKKADMHSSVTGPSTYAKGKKVYNHHHDMGMKGKKGKKALGYQRTLTIPTCCA